MQIPRSFLLSLALGCAVLTGAGLADADDLLAQSISNHNSNAPVNYDADRIELQDRQNRVVLSGNVNIEQAGLRINSARTTVAYTNENGLKINRIDATGGVVVTKGDDRATGNAAVYDFNRRIITMAGNVALRRGTDTLNGGRLVIDLRSGRSVIDGRASGGGPAGDVATGGNGRVSGTFSVPQKDADGN